jgi:hypothetical protein
VAFAGADPLKDLYARHLGAERHIVQGFRECDGCWNVAQDVDQDGGVPDCYQPCHRFSSSRMCSGVYLSHLIDVGGAVGEIRRDARGAPGRRFESSETDILVIVRLEVALHSATDDFGSRDTISGGTAGKARVLALIEVDLRSLHDV